MPSPKQGAEFRPQHPQISTLAAPIAEQRQRGRHQVSTDTRRRPAHQVQRFAELVGQPGASAGHPRHRDRQLQPHQRRQRRLCRGEGERRRDRRPDLRPGLGLLRAGRGEDLDQRLGGGGEAGGENVVDVLELRVEAAGGDRGTAGDRPRVGADDAALGEDLGGGAEQAPALVRGDLRGGDSVATGR